MFQSRYLHDLELSDLCTNNLRVLHASQFSSPRELLRKPSPSTYYNNSLVICARSRDYRSYIFNVQENADTRAISWNTMWWKPCADRIVEYLFEKMRTHDYSNEYHVVFGLACGYNRGKIRTFLQKLSPGDFARVFRLGSSLFRSLYSPSSASSSSGVAQAATS